MSFFKNSSSVAPSANIDHQKNGKNKTSVGFLPKISYSIDGHRVDNTEGIKVCDEGTQASPLTKAKKRKRKLNKMRSLSDMIIKRQLHYPDDRKWIGNSKELIY